MKIAKAISHLPEFPTVHQYKKYQLLLGVLLTNCLGIAELRAEDDWASSAIPLLQKYCFDCHGNDTQEAEVNLQGFASAESLADSETLWKETLKRIEFGAMPPDDADQPSDEERGQMIRGIESALYGGACDLDPKPGKVTVRRLNRNEYNNTIRDLFGLRGLRPADAFPSDEVGAGFDNNGDVLSLPPMLLEKYVEAAEQVAAAAITDPSTLKKIEARWQADTLKIKGKYKTNNFEIHTVESDGVISGDFEAPYDGDYGLAVQAASVSKDETVELEAFIDGKSIGKMKFGFRDGSGSVDRQTRSLKLDKGKHSVEVRGVQSDAQEPAEFRMRGLQFDGPRGIPKSEVADCHWQLVRHRAQKGKRSTLEAAKENLKTFLPQAFRSPVDDETISRYAALADLAVQREETFERGMQIAVTAALVSPRFLFRSEKPDESAEPGDSVALNSYQLATRLSYFLWSSMPDGKLRELADKGKLTDEAVLRGEVKRLIYDDRGEALVENFADQWLGLRNLADLSPDPKQFPQFDEALRTSMVQETRLTFLDCVRSGKSVLSLLDAEESFLDQRLAKHYGIKDVKGDEFRAVSLAGSGRRGILTQAGILMLTSNPTRTSPVKRGKWVMENILGTPPPEPPAGIPELEETASSNPDAPLREQLAIHRESPNCASCHRVMDQIGFSFEHFDVIGSRRELDGKHPIDASGELPSGESFEGAAELIGILRQSRGEMFVTELTRRLMTFALGRELKRQDQCVVDDIVKATKADGWKFIDIASAIVLSQPFRYQTIPVLEETES